MKRLAALLLSISAVVLTFPVGIPAGAATSSNAKIIDMHGSKTYIGTSSDWGKTWDEDNFEDVTGKNVDYGGDVTVKAGTVGDITLGNDATLTINGGAVDDAYTNGIAKMTDGDVKSLEADGDLTISGGNVRHDAVSDDGEITLSSTVAIGGNVTGKDITLNSGVKASISGIIKGTGMILLNDCTLKAKQFEGNNTGSLEIKGYKDTLPPILNMSGIVVDANTTAMVKDSISADSLAIKDKAEFVTTSTLDLDSLYGPGTLTYQAGKMTIHTEILGTPLLVFSNPVENGTIAFKADAGTVDESDVDLYNYQLESYVSGSYDNFKLKNSLTDGITFDKGNLVLDGKTPGTVKAAVKPDLSKYADGTKIKWEMYGDTSAFSFSSGSNSLTSTVSVSDTKMHRATLIAYLVDKSGNRLKDYRSASCSVTAGYSDDGTDDGTSTGVSLDTSEVSILVGTKYTVMARTSSTSAAPHAMSYNSSVATVGAPVAATDKNGNPGFLYPITGTGKGQATIEIGVQKVNCTVSAGIMVDTSSYTMSPGQKYVIGVKASGIDYRSINVSSVNSCTQVQFLKRTSDGMCLYTITGKSVGTGYVMFDLGSNGVALKTQIDVQSGVSPHGSSSRMVLLA